MATRKTSKPSARAKSTKPAHKTPAKPRATPEQRESAERAAQRREENAAGELSAMAGGASTPLTQPGL